MDHLRISTTNEPPMQASKWLTAQVLIDEEEMRSLLDFIGTFALYTCGAVCLPGEERISTKNFLQAYSHYVQLLKEGQLPQTQDYRLPFSAAMTATLEALYVIPLNDGQQLVRVGKPVIQLQAHHIDYSSLDKKFRSMVFGENNIPWGIQFSFPQLYQDRTTGRVEKVLQTSPNASLFQNLQKWVRQHTIPTPFYVEEKQYNVPMRLGKQCLSWINRHPQLVAKGIKVLI